jgi:hypothetical protein
VDQYEQLFMRMSGQAVPADKVVEQPNEVEVLR